MCTETDTGAPSGINLLLRVTYFLLLPNSMFFFCVLLYSIIICIIQYVYYYVLLSVCCWDSVSVSEIVRTLYGKVSKSCSGASPPLHQCPMWQHKRHWSFPDTSDCCVKPAACCSVCPLRTLRHNMRVMSVRVFEWLIQKGPSVWKEK